ncbi:MAG: hypothetical protein ACR2OU_05100 [Thermomicrobiales bacterium]
MVHALGAWMEEGQIHFMKTGRHAKDKSLLKSYIVEANTTEAVRERGGVAEFFSLLDTSIPVQVEFVDDPTVSMLKLGESEVEFYLDSLDPRFWVLHTTAPASAADVTVRKLVHRTRLLDSVWLPTHEFENWIGEISSPRRMTAKFALNTGIYRDSIPEEELGNDSMLFSIGSVGNVLERWRRFREIDELSSMQALWSARGVRRSSPDDDIFSLEEVTAAGKVTVRGNSFLHHEAFLRDLQERYRSLITGWENSFRLGWKQSDSRKYGVTPTGSVAEVYWPFEMDTSDQESLLSVMFNCGEPYRLYGIPQDQGRSRYSIRAVDLHTGDKLDIELLPTHIWVYLSENACGNVLARLLTNLQHYHDARTALNG